MSIEKTRNYISNLPVAGSDAGTFDDVEAEDIVGATDLNNLPKGIVTGSNLLEFSGETSSELRSTVALCLLAANRVAANDTAILTPDQWMKRHNTVLENLNWVVEGGGNVEAEFDTSKLTVNKAIIPFLTAALSPGLGAASLILTAVNQISEMDKDAPWFTLWDRESRRFGVSEFQFSTLETSNGETTLKMASARFDVSYGRTQILFFKFTSQSATFQMAKSALRTTASLLEAMNDELKIKLAVHSKKYIRDANFGS